MKSALGRLRAAFGDVRDGLLGTDTAHRAAYNRIVHSLKRRLLAHFPDLQSHLYAPVPLPTAPDVVAVPSPPPPPPPPFHAWWTATMTSPDALAAMRQTIGPWPRIAVIVREAGTPVAFDRTLISLQEQVYGGWELVVPPACARSARARVEPRLRVVDVGHRAPNAAEWLDTAMAHATAPYCHFITPGDTLAPDALWHIANRLAADDVDVLYTDEDAIGAHAFHMDPVFRTDWAPETFLSQPFMGAGWTCRRRLARELDIGDCRIADPVAADVEMALRLTERTQAIVHLPCILHHRDGTRPSPDAQADAAICRALVAAAARRGREATASSAGRCRFHLRYRLTEHPRVAIIIPTRDRIDLLRACIESIENLSTYANREIIVVDNGSSEPESLAYFAEIAPRYRVISDPRPFNWAALNNAAAALTDAPMLLFLNNDIEVIAPDWIEAMLEHAQNPEVGVVGARLVFGDGRLQHAGVVLGIGDYATHAFHQMPSDGNEYMGFASFVRNWSAVTGACILVRHTLFDAVGGFDERLRVVYNDIDFCLRIGELGLRHVCTPHATLTHHESLSRGSLHPREDAELFRTRWQRVIVRDPHYNPNLSLWHIDFRPRLLTPE